jgi:hypothetical protein
LNPNAKQDPEYDAVMLEITGQECAALLEKGKSIRARIAGLSATSLRLRERSRALRERAEEVLRTS